MNNAQILEFYEKYLYIALINRPESLSLHLEIKYFIIFRIKNIPTFRAIVVV